jgi:hypothetical protein
VKLIDGRVIENAQLVNVQREGDEGSRSATAIVDGKEYNVYNSIVDGFNNVWAEQMSYETWKMLKNTVNNGVVEGTIEKEE